MGKPSASQLDSVESFVRQLGHPHEAMVLALRRIILDADQRIREEVKWNAPSFFTTEHFATFNLRAKVGVQLVLHLGTKKQLHANVRASLADFESMLVWKAPDRALLQFPDMMTVGAQSAQLTRVIQIWIDHVPADALQIASVRADPQRQS